MVANLAEQAHATGNTAAGRGSAIMKAIADMRAGAAGRWVDEGEEVASSSPRRTRESGVRWRIVARRPTLLLPGCTPGRFR